MGYEKHRQFRIFGVHWRIEPKGIIVWPVSCVYPAADRGDRLVREKQVGVGRINKRAVDGLEVGETLFDTEVRGFMVRGRIGVKSYALKYVVGGRQRILTLGEHGPLTPSQARAMAQAAKADVLRGADPQTLRDVAKTKAEASLFERFAQIYDQRHIARKKPRSAEEDRRLLRLHLLPRFGSRPLSSVTRSDVLKLKDDLDCRPIAFNRCRALLHSMFERARAWDLHSDPNPAAGVVKNPEKPRERYLSGDEYHRLFEALDAAEGTEHPSVITCIRLLALTGARLGEILSLRWDHVDFEHSALRLPDSKTGSKVIPLGSAAVAVLEVTPRISDFVCRGLKADAPIAPPQRQWRRIRVAAGLPGLRLHDLRHGFASVAAVGGESLKLVGAALGHKQIATTERYAHLQLDPVRALADRTAGRIASFGQQPKCPR
jgi:integrase